MSLKPRTKVSGWQADLDFQTFWLFQTYLHDLAANPATGAFQTCRRVYNKVQHIVFGLADAARHDKIKENILPVTVLSSFVLASVALPMIPQWAGPLAVAQARKPQPLALAETAIEVADVPKPPARAKTVTALSSRSRRTKEGRVSSAPDANQQEGTRPRTPRSAVPTTTVTK